MPQTLVRDASYQPEDAVTRVARCLFAWQYPTSRWEDPAAKHERDNCFLLAVQFKEIFGDQWTLSEATERLTAASIHLVFRNQPITPEIRKEITDYAESYVEDLVKLYVGDALTIKNPLAGKLVS